MRRRPGRSEVSGEGPDFGGWPPFTPRTKLPDGPVVAFLDTRRRLRWAPVSDLTEIPFEHCNPVRQPAWHRRQGHLPGFYWFAKTDTHIVHESQLEKAHLILLDFDRRVRGVLAQPFALRVKLGAVSHWHTPDYLVFDLDGRQHILEVKPAMRRARPEWASIERAMRDACEVAGWQYQIVDDPDPIVLDNLRWLSSFRRPVSDPNAVIDTILAACKEPASFGALARCLGDQLEVFVRPFLFHLIWSHRLCIDLTQPFDDTTIVSRPGEG